MGHQPSLRVTVVIPHFESPRDLASAVHSIRASDTHADIVIVDNSISDASRDAGARISSEVAGRWLGMSENVGFGSACNAGAAICDTELVMFLNQDAELSPAALPLLVDYLEHNPPTAAISPSVVTPEGLIWFNGGRYRQRSGRILLRDFGEQHRGGPPQHSLFLSGCALMVRREAFNNVGGFDERFFLYYEDVDLSERLRRAGHTLTVIPNAVVTHHRDHAGDPMRNLSKPMLTNTIRSRRLFASTLRDKSGWIARMTLPLEVARLAYHAIKAKPKDTIGVLRALADGLLR